jgi:hypothetical protein
VGNNRIYVPFWNKLQHLLPYALEKIQIGNKEWRALGLRWYIRQCGGNHLHQYITLV